MRSTARRTTLSGYNRPAAERMPRARKEARASRLEAEPHTLRPSRGKLLPAARLRALKREPHLLARKLGNNRAPEDNHVGEA
jgi:hypothetical protein